jgi:hypothetical protein
LLKCCGSRGAGTSTPLSTATKASTEQKGSHFNKSASVSLRIGLFPPTSGPHPPPLPPPPPQTQIDFESRLGAHDVLNDCTMTVDSTDFRIPQKGAATKGNAFASHKYAGKSALRYELGVDILAGNLVWIQVGGPQEKMSFFQIASGPILSIPIYLKTYMVPVNFR